MKRDTSDTKTMVAVAIGYFVYLTILFIVRTMGFYNPNNSPLINILWRLPLDIAPLVLVFIGGAKGREASRLAMIFGLFLSSAADIAIGFNFLVGMAVFALALISFACSFWLRAPATGKRELALAALCVAVTAGLTALIYLMGALAGVIAIAMPFYIFLLCLALWRALCLPWGANYGRAGMIGMILFYMSDIILALVIFVVPEQRWLYEANIALFYAALILFVAYLRSIKAAVAVRA